MKKDKTIEHTPENNSLLDKVFVPTLWILSIVATVMITILCIKLREHHERQNQDSDFFVKSQLNVLKGYEVFLNNTVNNYVVADTDTALIDYGGVVIQNLEEICVLSPFDAVRVEAVALRNRYLTHFPMYMENRNVLDLQMGDIVVRHNNSLHSELFRKMSVNEKKYSHLGIIEIVDSASVMVHHSAANDYTGIGGIQSSKIYQFMPKGDFDVAVYRISEEPEVQQRIVSLVHDLKARDIPFDMMFDLADSTRMYCAEMVAYAVNRGMGKTVITPSGTFMGRPVITIEDCYRVPEAKLVYQRVGTVSY